MLRTSSASSFSIWGCVLRVVLRDVYFEGPNRV